jgi:protein-L-isoaspartate(D-aspartate) O-methyltransferase
MIRQQIVARGVRDSAVLDAMARIPRECFVPDDLQASAYDDSALPLGPNQTISQPYIVGFMTEQLACESSSRVLEVGTGSGYQASILACVAGLVHTVELDGGLAAAARQRFELLGLTNVHGHVGDGGGGWPGAAPYDRIMVTAACGLTPDPLVEQLADGGVLLLPVGAGETQTLIRLEKESTELRRTILIGCRFVKLGGRYGTSR